MGTRKYLQQGSQLWKVWRHNGIGGSDAGVIMGNSRFKTLEDLTREKIQAEPKPMATNYLMQRGHDLEPVIRSKYQSYAMLYFTPAEFEHEKYPFLKCSLDGLNEENNLILEIKTTQSLSAKQKVKNAQIPDYYKAQLQHNLMVSGSPCLHFVLSVDGVDIVFHKEFPDEEYQKSLLEKELAFWERVQKAKRSLEHNISKPSP